MGTRGPPVTQQAQLELDSDQQTVVPESSPMQVDQGGQVDIGCSTARVTKTYPQTQELTLRTQGTPKVHMLYQDKNAPEATVVLKLTGQQRRFYLLQPEIEQMACPTAAFGEPPSCSGTGCIPCYVAHLEPIHNPDDSKLEVERILAKWQAILAPYRHGPSYPEWFTF